MKHILFSLFVLFPTILFSQGKLQLVTSPANIADNTARIDDPGLNYHPDVIVVCIPDENMKSINPHPLGIRFDGKKWAIFNEDLVPMPPGLSCNVYWSEPNSDAFLQKASAQLISKGAMVLDHPTLNNDPTVFFEVSQILNFKGMADVYNNSDIIVRFDPDLQRWVVSNANGAPVPEGAAFSVLIRGRNQSQITAPSDEKGSLDPVAAKTIGGTMSKTAPDPEKAKKMDGAGSLPAISGEATDPNLGFEEGLLRWTAIGNAFAHQPVQGNSLPSERVLTTMEYSNGGLGGDYWKGLPYRIGVKGNNWIGTYENGNGDQATGTLTSSNIVATHRYLHFLLGGGKNISNLYIELQVKIADYQRAWGAGKFGFWGNTSDGYTRVNRISSLLNSEELFRYFFDLDAELNHQFHNKVVRICIVDNNSGRWGHINVDDFGQADDLSGFIHLIRGGFRLNADIDKPVWGFFDSHAHPAADEAFGKNYYVGSSNAELSETWSNAVCTASHTAGRTLDGFTNMFDQHKFFDGGWPNMIGYPRFNGKMHQKYQKDLIKRAWQGGLKIFCALGINNMYLATRALGHNTNGEAIDDESVLFRQLNVIRRMAAENSEWMEIASTPRDARRIILEGKLCVILGVESDLFGNFKSPDCQWADRPSDRPLVEITDADAHVKLQNKLDEYFRLGIRQVLPLHYLSKPFGGTAVFNGNTFLPQISFYDHVRIKSGVPDNVGFSLYEDFPTGAALVGDGMTYAAYAARAQKQDEGTEISMVNADGLTAIGEVLVKKLMKKGFIMDLEHASYQSKRDIIRISQENADYPVIASHCTPEGLSYIWTSQPVRFSGSNEEKVSHFMTSTIRYVAHEMELNDESYEGIRRSGGTVGVFTLLNQKRNYSGVWGPIGNFCPGSTTTMAQMYCYSLDRLGGRGVGLASDLPMVDALCPRFGPYAAWSLTAEETTALKVALRNYDRFQQQNGVRYDVPVANYFHELFEGGQIDLLEEDAWKALAANEAGVTSLDGRPGNLLRGLIVSTPDELQRPCVFCGDGPWEQAAMYCLKHGVQAEALTMYHDNEHQAINRLFDKLQKTWILWQYKTGTNAPLRRCITGNRYWDFNLDGLAHYGLLPDMLQDFKNIGMRQLQLIPLFRSAEDYIQMWEKADLAKNNVTE